MYSWCWENMPKKKQQYDSFNYCLNLTFHTKVKKYEQNGLSYADSYFVVL